MTSPSAILQDVAALALQNLIPGVSTPKVEPGVWRGFPSPTMRLRMGGIGTVTMDARNGAGVITLGVYSYTTTGTTVVQYAYPGDDADSIRITLTGTATAEVI